MSNFIIGFGLGIAASTAWAWFAAHPDKRKEVIARIKALFIKKDAP